MCSDHKILNKICVVFIDNYVQFGSDLFNTEKLADFWLLLSESVTTGTKFKYVHTFLTSNFSVLLLITNVKTRTKAHCLAHWLLHTDVKHTEFINDFKVTKTKEMAKTVLLIIDSFQISMFMTGESTVKTKILI